MIQKCQKYRFLLASLVMTLAVAFPFKKSAIYHGNSKTNLFHHSACDDFYGQYEKIEFKSQEEALKAKFKHCPKCFAKIDGKWVTVAPHSK